MPKIPKIPQRVKRVNVALDEELCYRAAAHHIDVHAFFRQALLDAVQELDDEQGRKPSTSMADLFFPSTETHDIPPAPTSDRLKEAAKYLTGG